MYLQNPTHIFSHVIAQNLNNLKKNISVSVSSSQEKAEPALPNSFQGLTILGEWSQRV
jgi:hypothetical protein